jgi:hypothetical protein
MVRVEIRRKPDGTIAGFRVTGHAEFAEAGKDIVCAGISAVTIGTVNAAEALLGVRLVDKTPKRGTLEAVVPDGLAGRRGEDVQLLLETMTHMVRDIESAYGTYVKVTEKTIK